MGQTSVAGGGMKALVEKARVGGDLTFGEVEALERWSRVRERLGKMQRQQSGADRFLVTRAEFAGLLRVTGRTIHNRMTRGELPDRADSIRWNLGEVLRHLSVLAARARQLPAAAADPYTQVRTEIWGLRLARERGEVVEIDAVRRAMAPAFVAFKNGLQALPDRLALMVPAEMREELRAEARALTDGLLRDLQEAVRGNPGRGGAA